jgi:hypothetical protein
MIRRSFIARTIGAALAVLIPWKAKAVPHVEVVTIPDFVPDDFFPRNSGRTYRGLCKAIEKLQEFPVVVYVVSTEREAMRAWCEVGFICSHNGIVNGRCMPTVTQSRYDIDGRTLRIISCESNAWRGFRAHFIFDHSVNDLPTEKYQELLACVAYMHEGEWPPCTMG